MKYRPEIDGLRAVAVLAVVIYHAQFGERDTFFLSGGYIGVDVFFVISGYLITSIILREMQTAQFSFAGFYERRARRILPALFTVISCSIPVAWWLMLPKALTEYTGSILSSLFFGSNFWFLAQDSYTAEPSLLMPFLHTWSLSIEEQFYVFFPILLLVLWKLARSRLLLVSLLIFVVSLGLAQWLSSHYIDANFYLLPTRMWELAGGVILAVWQHMRNVTGFDLPRKFGEASQVFAAVLMVLSFLWFDHNTSHPSLITLVPVGATMLIIQTSRPELLLTKLLSSHFIVLLGKWSYSFYLWHFPIFAFARIQGVADSVLQKLGLIAVSLLLSVVTYYWVEQPARRKNFLKRATFFRWIGVWFAVLVTCMVVFYTSNGVPQRLGVLQSLFESAKIVDVKMHGVDCHQRVTEATCYFPGEKDQPVLINVGDSHAKTLGNDLKSMAERFGFGYLQLSANNCPLVRDAYGMVGARLNNNCHPAGQAKRIAKIKQVKNAIIVLTARYPLYLAAEGFDNRQGGIEDIPPTWIAPQAHRENDAAVAKSLIQSTINELLDTGVQVVMVYPIPEAGWDIPTRVRKQLDGYPASQKLGAFKSMQISTPYQLYKERTALSYQMLDAVADRPNLMRVFPNEVLCSETEGLCFTHNGEALFYHDDDHLSPYGSALVVGQIEQLIRARGLTKESAAQ